MRCMEWHEAIDWLACCHILAIFLLQCNNNTRLIAWKDQEVSVQ